MERSRSAVLGAGPIHTAVDHKDLDHVVLAAASGLPVSTNPNAAVSLSGHNTVVGAMAHPRRKNAIRALKKCARVAPGCLTFHLTHMILPMR